MNDIHVAIIGCGGVTLQNHLPGLALCKNVHVTALCDSNPAILETARQQTGAARVSTNWEEIVKRDDVHAVIIATPNIFHPPIAIAAAKHGKHVLCEKPLALNHADALAMATAADAARVVFGEPSDRIVTVLALLTLPSLVNAQLLAPPRVLFAMSRDGLLTSAVARVNRGGTPTTALLLHTGAAVFLVVTGTYERLLAITTFLFMLAYTSAFLAVIVLRRREPALARPFRVPGYPWTTLVVLGGSVAFLLGVVVDDPSNSAYGAALLVAGVPLYLFMMRRPS